MVNLRYAASLVSCLFGGMHLWWAAYMTIYFVLNLWCAASWLCCIFGVVQIWWIIYLVQDIFDALHLWCVASLVLCICNFGMHWHLLCAESLVRCNFGELYLGCNISLVFCIFGALHVWWCLIGSITIVCLWCIVSWVQYIFDVVFLVLSIVSYIAQACYRSGATTLFL